MDLSQAIRIGDKIRPQVKGRLFGPYQPRTLEEQLNPVVIGSCALGAALEGASGMSSSKSGISYEKLQFLFPLLGEVAKCPVEGCFHFGMYEVTAQRVIEHLNDHHEWSRRAIAAWVKALETK